MAHGACRGVSYYSEYANLKSMYSITFDKLGKIRVDAKPSSAYEFAPPLTILKPPTKATSLASRIIAIARFQEYKFGLALSNGCLC